MLLKIKEISLTPRKYLKHKFKRILILQCDMCKIEFELPYTKDKSIRRSHFCGKSCFKLASKTIVQQHRSETNLERYGVENAFSSTIFKEKIKETNIEKYGVENPQQNNEIRKNTVITNIERYGSENVFGSKQIQNKIKKTNIEKYGVENSMQLSEFKNKAKQTLLRNYGVEHPFQSKEIYDRAVQTWIKNYGVDNPMKNINVLKKVQKTCIKRFNTSSPLGNKKIQNKIRLTMLERYGVENPSQNKEINVKIHATMFKRYGVEHALQSLEIYKRMRNKMKQNNSFGKSKPEDHFYKLLCTKFYVDNIERQKLIPKTHQPCDFYIKSIDTYIQFDGIYWHGLDRPFKQLFSERYNSKRSLILLKNFLRDRRQNKFCIKNNIKLIRVRSDEDLNLALSRIY